MKCILKYQTSGYTLIILLAITSIFANTSENSNESDVKFYNSSHSEYRLPTKIHPISYDLFIRTHLTTVNFTYEGEVKINLRVLQKTEDITLHADQLIIHEEKTLLCKESKGKQEFILIHTQNYNPSKQFYIIKLRDSLEPGEYLLQLSFISEVQDNVFGFYRSAYEVNGKKKWAGFTQFSPNYARRAFPCMDEPYMKATYNIRIGHYANETVTSNTPIESILPTEKSYYYVTKFERTPRIPTYIVGWAIHDYTYEQTNSTSYSKLWTRKSMKGNGFYILKQCDAIYEALQKWLKVENPLKKMDHVAVPDFNFNAMENWGLITFRESAVLFKEGITPTNYLIKGLSTLAHEYAHTWFGNIVTPKFWDVAWLKEGFATFFQYYGLSLVDHINNVWKPSDLFVISVLQPALLADHNGRTMNNRDIIVGNSDSLMKTLDFTAYKKGGSILRMLQHILRDDAFSTGLQNYVNHMAYSAAVPSDLYKFLQEAGNSYSTFPQDVYIKDVVESWANQAGYPVVTVTRNYSTNTAKISQEPFYLDADLADVESKKRRWWIPLNFAIESAPEMFNKTEIRGWLTPQAENQTMAFSNPSEWVVVNLQQIGYFRVNYDDINWKMLTEQLISKNLYVIHKLNRASLLDDAFNLARAAYISYDIPIKLSKYLAREGEYEPWVAAMNNFKFLYNMIYNDPIAMRGFKELLIELTTPLYQSLGFEERPTDTVRTKLLRNLILSTACLAQRTDCLDTSKALFESWLSNPRSKISADLKSFVYCIGIRYGDDNVWYAVWNKFLRTELHTEQELLLNGLGCTRTPNLINAYLNASISLVPAVRKQYRFRIVDTVASGNPENVNVILEFITKNLHHIINSRGHDFLAKMITVIGKKMITEEQWQKLNKFVVENKPLLEPIINIANNAVISAANNVAWVKKGLLCKSLPLHPV